MFQNIKLNPNQTMYSRNQQNMGIYIHINANSVPCKFIVREIPDYDKLFSSSKFELYASILISDK